MPTQQIDIVAKDKTRAALSGVNRRLNRVNKTAGKSNSLFGGMTTKIVALGAALGGIGIVKGIVSVNARFEDLRTTLASVTGGVEQGGEAFKFIEKFATQTQFSVEDLTTTFIKLKTAGIEPTRDLLTTFTDAAAVTTDQIGSLQAITDLFSRTTAGGLGLEEINRLTDRGIPALDILQEKLGLSRNEISEFGKTAEGAKIIVDALASGINERFGGATQERLQNISTKMSNLAIATDTFKDKIGQEMSPAFGGFLDQVTNGIVNSDKLASVIGQVLGSAINGAAALMEFMAHNMTLIQTGAITLGLVLGAQGLTGAVTKARIAFNLLKGAMMSNPFGLLAVAVAGLITFLSIENGLGKTFAQVKAVLDVLGRGFKTFTTYLSEKVTKVVDFIKEKFVDFMNALIKTYNATIGLIPGIDKLEEKVVDLGGGVADLVDNGIDYLTESTEEMKQALLDAIPEEVVDLAKEVKDAVKDAGDAYDEAAKSVDGFKESQTSLVGATVNASGVNLADPTGSGVTADPLKTGQNEQMLTAAMREELKLLKTKQLLQLSIRASTNEAFKEETQLMLNFRNLEADIQNSKLSAEQKFSLIQSARKKLTQEQLALDNKAADAEKERLDAIAEALAEQKKLGEEALAQRVKDLQSSLMTEDEIRDNQYNKDLRDLDSYYGSRVAFDQEYFKTKLRLEERHARAVEAINQRNYDKQLNLFKTGQFAQMDLAEVSAGQQVKFALDAGSEVLGALAKNNKKAFELQKKVQIAQALMNVATGVTKAIAQGGIFGMLMAGGIIAMGAAQIATIKSQQYSGRRYGGPVSNSDSYIVGENGPELFTPGATGRITPNEAMGGNKPVNVTFNIDATDARSVDELIVQRKPMIVQMIRQATMEKGNRPNF